MWPARPVPCTPSLSLPLYLNSLPCWSRPSRSGHGHLYPEEGQVCCSVGGQSPVGLMGTFVCRLVRGDHCAGERSVWGPWPSLCRSEGPAALSLATGFGPPLLFPDLVMGSYPCCLLTGSLGASAWALRPGHLAMPEGQTLNCCWLWSL